MITEYYFKDQIIQNPHTYMKDNFDVFDYEYPVFGLAPRRVGAIDLILIKFSKLYLVEIKLPKNSLSKNGFAPVYDSIKILAYREMFLLDTNRKSKDVIPTVMLPAEYLNSTSKYFLRKLKIKFIPVYFRKNDFYLDFDELKNFPIPGWKEIERKNYDKTIPASQN